ncbi:unnamed protein product [Caenorhabditis bovis]|uniref:F-box domain-containing protein n=1 Tax=Caenorhabditis bovis TaxID=2654633 RepID=A0A8S1FFB6_9PELO|nr:unnamed protein product [Caenorhabditis bovis]
MAERKNSKADPSKPSFVDVPIEIAGDIVKLCDMNTRLSLSMASKALYHFEKEIGYDISLLQIVNAELREFGGVPMTGVTIYFGLNSPKQSMKFHFLQSGDSTDVMSQNTRLYHTCYMGVALKLYERVVNNSKITRVDLGVSQDFIRQMPSVSCKQLRIWANSLIDMDQIFDKLENKDIEDLEIQLISNYRLSRQYPEINNAHCLTLSPGIGADAFMALTARWMTIMNHSITTNMLEAFRWANGEGPKDFLYLEAGARNIDITKCLKNVCHMKFVLDMWEFLIEKDERVRKFFKSKKCWQIFSNVSTDSATLCVFGYDVWFVVTGKMVDMDIIFTHPNKPVEQ